MAQPLWKTVRQFLKKWKMELLYYLAIPLLHKYPKYSRRPERRGMDICIFIFPSNQKVKEPKCSSADKWTKCGICNAMECSSALKRNDILTHAATWTRVVSSSRENDYCLFPPIWSNMVDSRGWEQKGVGSYCLISTVFQFCKRQTSGDGWKWWSHNNVNVLHDTELKMIKMVHLCYIYFTQFKQIQCICNVLHTSCIVNV